MNFTHDMNDGHTLFVFGSNEAGLHGAARQGAAGQGKANTSATGGKQ